MITFYMFHMSYDNKTWCNDLADLRLDKFVFNEWHLNLGIVLFSFFHHNQANLLFDNNNETSDI